VGRHAGFAVRLVMVRLDQESAHARIQLGQREHWFGRCRARRRVPRLMAQEELIDGPEDALDLPSAAWLARNRKDDRHVQVSCDLLKVV